MLLPCLYIGLKYEYKETVNRKGKPNISDLMKMYLCACLN